MKKPRHRTVRIPDDLDRLITRRARKAAVSRTRVIVAALREALDAPEPNLLIRKN